MKNNSCIIIPIYKNEYTESEKMSFKRCIELYSNYDIYIVTHASLDLSKYEQLSSKEIKKCFFDKLYFKNIAGYNQLLLSSIFYKSFSDYQHMLIYQLDAFILKDELDYWCTKNYDYIGAPWFKNYNKDNNSNELWAVGNGGFSLRNIPQFLMAFQSNVKPLSLFDIWNLYSNYSSISKLLRIPKMVFMYYSSNNNINNIYKLFGENEDRFWSFFAQKLHKSFKVAPLEEALKFAFECNPRKMFELNQNQLPFGVHAWEKYDIDFWKPILHNLGYKIE